MLGVGAFVQEVAKVFQVNHRKSKDGAQEPSWEFFS